MCQIDDVQQQTSKVDQIMQAKESNGKCPIKSTEAAMGMTRHATRQSVTANDVRK